MNSNLMPKIAEMLGVKLEEFVTIEFVNDPKISYNVSITENGLKFDDKPKVFNHEEYVLSCWLRGHFRVKEDFPKDGDIAYAFSTGEPFCGRMLPSIVDFKFDSSSQFHLLLKEKGLLHKTIEEAIKCFEKDYNTFKEMQDGK